LDKKFYVVIPFSALELGVAQTLTSIFRRNQGLPFPEDYILAKAQTALAPKKDHLIRLFARIGLVAKQLENKELIRLYYLIYNSEKSQKKETS